MKPFMGDNPCPFIIKSNKRGNRGKPCHNRSNWSYLDNGIEKYSCGTHCKKKPERQLLPREIIIEIPLIRFSQLNIHKPSEINSVQWLFYFLNDYKGLEVDGKLLFYFRKKTELDNMWYTFVNLYINNELTGIHSIKVSTIRNNPRSDNNDYGVIVCYCGPSNNKNLLEAFCKNILSKIKYKFNYVYYKTENQTKQGTRATGTTVNHFYVFKNN